jgi:hypothetical protein
MERERVRMLVDDRPAQRAWNGPEWDDDPGQADNWRGYFDDVVDVICPDAHSRGPRYGYGAGPRPAQEGRTGGRHVARHGKGRRGPGNRTGVAALTAAAVVGTGVGAGVLGVVPFMPPTATSPGVTAAVHATATAGTGALAQPHTGYMGKHRKPDTASPAHLGAQAGTSRAGSAPAGFAYGPASPASSAGPAGFYQAGTSSAPAPAASQQPSPQSPSSSAPHGSGTGTGSTGTGSGAGGASSTGGGNSGGGSGSGGQGLVGGVVGGVTGLVGGLL